MTRSMVCAAWRRAGGVVLGCAALVGFAGVSAAQQAAPPRTLLTRAEVLVAIRAAAARPTPALAAARDRLLRDAAKAAAAPMLAVTDKRIRPPSGDVHDYYSLSPYWWPDSTKPDGLPYIRRDGITNPESKADLDQLRVAELGERVELFTLAWWLTGDRKWSTLATQQVRRWFLDSATRMTPHLRYAQLIRGRDQIRGTGIIDARGFMDVVDAVGMLEQSPDWTAADGAALRSWFREFSTWLRESPHGMMEHKAQNNHGSWYAAQAATYALFIGDTAQVRALAREARERIARQFTADGTQPEEMTRTRSMHYSMFNLEALGRLAEVTRLVGEDLWAYRAPNGASLAQGLKKLSPYIGQEAQWPGPQLDPVSPTGLARIFRRGALALGTGDFDGAIAALPGESAARDRSVLLFWRGS